MTGTIHAFDFLSQPLKTAPKGISVIFGSERFLKKLALKRLIEQVGGDSDPEFGVSELDADAVTWMDIHDELMTRSLFGGASTKLVVVDHADKLVSANREKLEAYLNPPKPKAKSRSKQAAGENGPVEVSASKSAANHFQGLLVLVVESWMATTRLYKEVEKIGLQIKCDAPLRGKGRDDASVSRWLMTRARQEYQFELLPDGAQVVIELTDCEFGRMDQELQKLALYCEPDGGLSLDTIKRAVGGWRSQTTWEAVDAAADGDAAKALELLNRLLQGGEHPLALFGQIASSLRRYSTATETVLRQLRNGERPNVSSALKSAGFWGNEMVNERRLKRIGSRRASQISQWLLEADLALKRSHSREELGRLILENLLVRLAE